MIQGEQRTLFCRLKTLDNNMFMSNYTFLISLLYNLWRFYDVVIDSVFINHYSMYMYVSVYLCIAFFYMRPHGRLTCQMSGLLKLSLN